MKPNFRKPLIIFTPKSLLRHPKAVSPLKDLANGGFQTVIDDTGKAPAQIKKVVFCQGKFYYDLLAYRESKAITDTVLVRIEQLYPLDRKSIDKVLSKYNKTQKRIWAQEEPANMGAWMHMRDWLGDLNLARISPDESAAPATGSAERFHLRHRHTIERVFNL